MPEDRDNAENNHQDISDYYIHKSTNQTLVLHTKDKDNVTLFNPATFDYYQSPTREFNKNLATGELMKARYLLGYSFVPHDESSPVKCTLASNNLNQLCKKLINIAGSVSEPSTIFKGESTVFNHCYIKDLGTNQYFFTANRLSELQDKVPELASLQGKDNKNHKLTFTPTSIDMANLTGPSTNREEHEKPVRKTQIR